MLTLQCMHDNLLKMHGFCWALHAKWYPSVRIDEEHPSKTRPRKEGIWKSRSKQKIGGAHLCHVGIAMHV